MLRRGPNDHPFSRPTGRPGELQEAVGRSGRSVHGHQPRVSGRAGRTRRRLLLGGVATVAAVTVPGLSAGACSAPARTVPQAGRFPAAHRSPAALIAGAHDRLRRAGAARFDVGVDSLDEDAAGRPTLASFTSYGAGTFDFGSDDILYDPPSDVSNEPPDGGTHLIGDIAYVPPPPVDVVDLGLHPQPLDQLKNRPWSEVRLDGVESSELSFGAEDTAAVSDPRLVLRLLDDAQDVIEYGDDTLQGPGGTTTPSTYYVADVYLDRAHLSPRQLVAARRLWPAGSFEIGVWLDHDQLVRRIRYRFVTDRPPKQHPAFHLPPSVLPPSRSAPPGATEHWTIREDFSSFRPPVTVSIPSPAAPPSGTG